MNNSIAALALHTATQHRPILARALISLCGSAERLLTTSRASLETDLEISDESWRAIKSIRARVDWARARNQLTLAEKFGVNILTPEDARYPAKLKEIPDYPGVIFVRGNPQAFSKPCVAIVGTRKASRYGRELTQEIAEQLAESGVVVVSGLAFGIDAEAHRAALAGVGETIGVLASGVDLITPRTHSALGESVMKSGLLCSEYLLGSKPEAFHYPQRNRIISGLSLAILVVEATEKSGTMWTAYHAGEQGRLLCACPGLVGGVNSAGPHRLLREGAVLIESAEQILELIHSSLSV